MPGWTEGEDSFLRLNYDTNSVYQLSLWLNTHTEDAIETRIKKLGLTKKGIKKSRKTKYWTYADVRTLKSRMNDPNADIASDMNRTTSSVRKMKEKLRAGLTFPTSDNDMEYVGVKGLRNYRDIAAEVAGRKLASHEHVHHIDVNQKNNNPSNLYICSSPEHHGRTHAQLDNLLYGLVHTLMESKVIKFEDGKYSYGTNQELLHLMSIKYKEQERCLKLGIPWKTTW